MAKLSWEQYDQLKASGWDDDKIAMHASKRGLEMPSNGFFGEIAKDVLVKPLVRVGQLASVGGAMLGGASLDKAMENADKPVTVGGIRVEPQKAWGQGGGKQILGDALTSASYLTPFGKITKALGGGVKGAMGAAATAGYAYETGQDLRAGQGAGAFVPGMTTLTSAIIPPALKTLGFAGKATGKTIRYATSQVTGLSPETITTLITKPSAVTAAEKAHLSSMDLAKQLQSSWRTRSNQLRATGVGYETIRSGGTVDLQKDIVSSVLNKYGLATKDGRFVRTSETVPMKKGDIDALNEFVELFGGKKTLTRNEFLNARQSLDQLAEWDATKSDISNKIAKELRAAYDAIGKKNIPGLAELDAKYAPEVKLLREIRKVFFEPNGDLKQTALSRVANISGKNKDILLSKAEQLVPGLGQKAQILLALNDITATSGQKVGQYLKAGLAGGAMSGGNPMGAIIAAFAGSPAISVPIIKAYGRTKGYANEAIESLAKKLFNGSRLTSGETMLYRNAVDEWLMNVSPGDQFLETKMGKAAAKYNAEGQVGMSVQSVEGKADRIVHFVENGKKKEIRLSPDLVEGWTKSLDKKGIKWTMDVVAESNKG